MDNDDSGPVSQGPILDRIFKAKQDRQRAGLPHHTIRLGASMLEEVKSEIFAWDERHREFIGPTVGAPIDRVYGMRIVLADDPDWIEITDDVARSRD